MIRIVQRVAKTRLEGNREQLIKHFCSRKKSPHPPPFQLALALPTKKIHCYTNSAMQ